MAQSLLERLLLVQRVHAALINLPIDPRLIREEVQSSAPSVHSAPPHQPNIRRMIYMVKKANSTRE